jgi:MYXO-CTERM domain-containing protein
MLGTPARALVFALLSIWLLANTGCSRPGEKRCTEVCEHFLDLYIASQWDEKLAKAASPEERATLEQQRAEERAAMRTDETRGFDTCVGRCNRRSRGDSADCVMNATTIEQAKACDGDEDSGCSASPAPGRSPLGPGMILVALGLFVLIRRRRPAHCISAH